MICMLGCKGPWVQIPPPRSEQSPAERLGFFVFQSWQTQGSLRLRDRTEGQSVQSGYDAGPVDFDGHLSGSPVKRHPHQVSIADLPDEDPMSVPMCIQNRFAIRKILNLFADNSRWLTRSVDDHFFALKGIIPLVVGGTAGSDTRSTASAENESVACS